MTEPAPQDHLDQHVAEQAAPDDGAGPVAPPGPDPAVPECDGTEPEVDETRAGPGPLEVLAEAVTSLSEAVATGRRIQEHQEGLLDKLHGEREQLREAERQRQRDPVLRDLIQLADTCLRNCRQWFDRTDVSAETAERVAGALGDVAEDVRLILERQGVEDFAPEVGDRFVRSEAKAVGSVPASGPEQDGLVAEVRRSGYRLGERVLRFSEVVVAQFVPDHSADQPAVEAGSTTSS